MCIFQCCTFKCVQLLLFIFLLLDLFIGTFRDVQASSILLDDRFEVRLGSLSSVHFQDKDIHQSRIAKFLRAPQ